MQKNKASLPYRDKVVLVTGGTGFIGAALAVHLDKLGARVHVTSRSEQRSRLQGAEDIAVHVIDLAKRSDVEKLVLDLRPDIVFNCASSLKHDQDLGDVETRIEEIFGIAKHVILASVAAKVKRVVHLGTIEEYGGLNVVADESMRESPISSYSLGKVMATHFALTVGRLADIETCVVRPAATYGPRQGQGMLIPNLIEAGLAGRDFDMNEGEQLRDFVYIDDLVDGIARVGAYEHAAGNIFNLGSEKPVRIRDVVETVVDLLPERMKVNFGARPYRPLDPTILALDSRKARDLLGWEPTTTLQGGLAATVSWYKDHYSHKTDV